jgi:tRNA(adenine34) deaminase
MGAAYSRQRLEDWMRTALAEARGSLREGNSGFGALVVLDGEVLAQAHDTDTTEGDPTAHAELKAIRQAAARTGGHLSGGLLVATHEPCPMCAAAALWAGIGELSFGFSIKEALAQGRRRIDLPARRLFELGGRALAVHEGVLREDCALLYNREVRKEVAALRGAGPAELLRLAADKAARRVQWFRERYVTDHVPSGSPLDDAYALFLARLGIGPDEAPVAERTDRRLVIRSANFCPTLEACRILGLDTREVCRTLSEGPTTALLRQLHPGLVFRRNYARLRPYAPYCEEMIELEG